jgi:hypothetical protein
MLSGNMNMVPSGYSLVDETGHLHTNDPGSNPSGQRALKIKLLTAFYRISYAAFIQKN